MGARILVACSKSVHFDLRLNECPSAAFLSINPQMGREMHKNNVRILFLHQLSMFFV